MLPNDNWRWLDSPDASRLHHFYACVAVVRADGRVLIFRRRRRELNGRVFGVESGKRHVERWLKAHGWIVF